MNIHEYYIWLLKAYNNLHEEYLITPANYHGRINPVVTRKFNRWAGKFRTEIKRIEMLLPK